MAPTVTPTPTATPAPTATATPSAASLRVQYKAARTNATDGEIVPHFRIVNTGSTSVPLAELTLRYWYTVDGDTTQNAVCDWAAMGCANVVKGVAAVSPTRTGADYSLQLAFTAAAGDVAAGTGREVQMRVHKTNWTAYNEANDYSFDPTKTAFAGWTRVTLYRNGVLVWGAEP